MTDVDDPLIGQLVLGRYRIVQLLAEGGMGAVFLARVEGAAGFSKPVVVKRILPHLSGSADDQAQFIREAQILSNLRHPGIVNVIDFGKLAGSHLMVLEYVHGYHLGQWMKYVIQSRGRMPWDACICVMLQVLAALQYAHTFTRSDGSRAGIIHRDISPANILIDVDGTVRLADFGIARMEADQTAQNRAAETVFKGKFPYAAPELFAAEKATPLTDIYACGVVLYQLLSGSNPFSAGDAAVIIRRVLTLIVPPISSVRADVPKALDAVLEQVLSKEPEDRYASAKEFAAALRALLPKPEAEVLAEVTAMIRTDFTGDMPQVLKRQSLESLEKAWRKVSSMNRIPLISSMPPTVKVDHVFVKGRDGTPKPVAAESPVQGRSPPPSNSNTKLVLAVITAGLLAAGAATAAVLLTRTRNQAPSPQFLVVESGSDRGEDRATGTDPTLTASASLQPSVAPTASPAPATSSTSKAISDGRASHADAPARDPLSALSHTFAKRQGSIQGCFRAHAMEISGSPEVSVRFSIDARGKVTSATVRPAALATTALGQCLEQVARSTDFGPQDKSLVFSIPITARVH